MKKNDIVLVNSPEYCEGCECYHIVIIDSKLTPVICDVLTKQEAKKAFNNLSYNCSLFLENRLN
jgi:hypothetical protein